MPKEYINSKSAHRPLGYTHAVAARGGRTIYVSGQVAFDQANQIVGRGDLAAQTRQVMRNLVAQLEAAGAKISDVVKITSYVVNYKDADRAVIRDVRNEFFSQENPPASTLIGVAALAIEGLLIEIEAVAITD